MATSDGTSTHHEARRLAAEAGDEVARDVERWPGAAGLLAVAALLTLLPSGLTVGPRWLPLAIAVVVVVAVVVVHRTMPRGVVHRFVLAIPAAASVGVVASVVLQATGNGDAPGGTHDLLLNAGLTWGANVFAFALWYWEIDGGGPSRRRKDAHASGDIAFPQMSMARAEPPWFPAFLDYLFFSFNTSTAFSPTDATALSRRAKVLMMAESTTSLVIIAVLVARANTAR